MSPASVAVRMSPVPVVLMVQPLKTATPAVVVEAQPESVPEPAVRAKVMSCVSLVTVLPPASSMVTVGWVVKAEPPVATPGSVVNTSWLGTPVPTSNELLVVVKPSPASVARRAYDPAMLMEQPLKLTAPPVLVAEQPERAPPGPELIAKAMPCVSAVTVLPPASSIVSLGWVTKTLPPMALSGSVVKAI